MEPERTLRRIRILTSLFIVGLLISGVTAIPLQQEVRWLAEVTGANEATMRDSSAAPQWAVWLITVRSALDDTAARHPLLFYGTDWLAFGHFVIALAFVGALRHPIRNRWLFDFGLVAAVLVIPWALIFGSVRGIPIWWRGIDCLFGVIALVPLWFCRKWSRELEAQAPAGGAAN